ncbi:MAG: hypothetical protein KDH96_00805 [Candidatus Riesia sp.]|nr:hypothetical protein [Candidatus Riesia sp.]
MNDNLTVIGNGHFIEHSFNGQVDGSNNTIFNSSNFEITGSNNVLFKGANINTFTNSNNNVFLTLSQPTLVDSANNNIVLKQVGGTLRGDHNLVWGEGFRIQVSGVAAGNNIVLGRNVALVTSNNTFVWSASEAGVDPNDDPEISDDGCFVLLDASPQDYFQTAADNEFVARFSGGFRLRTNAAGTVGVDLAANGSSWASVSSILTKDVIFDNISVDNLVDKFKNISFKVYKYKDDELNTQFLSTSAEEWHTLMDGITTPEFMVTRQGVLPGIRINDQINLALLLIQDIYSRLDTLHVE